MIPEVGQFALATALAVAITQAALPLAGAARNNPSWMAIARPAAQLQLLLVGVAYACLTYAFIMHDFSVAYVAANSNTALPLAYRIAAVWGAHEGSLLLWVLMLALWSAAVTVADRNLTQSMSARVLGVMGLISAGFLIFLLFASNPFLRLVLAPAEGRDLNPLLQDPGMVLHPPLLYMGYVGFSVAFAFAIAALLSGRLDAAWARWSRPWTTAAWAFLTFGIALGSFWAYYELGWGGWWFWDPVENASFVPWLVGTALMHSLAVTEKRGCLRSWTVLLAIAAFALSLLGTFLVRSGVLSSVHAFATDPKRGIFILTLLAVTIGGALALFTWRAPRIGLGGRFDFVSREVALLGNNVLLAVAAASVMLGTLYPLALDALGLGKLSVGAPYFEAVFFPLIVPALVLMGFGVNASWKRTETLDLVRRLRWAAVVSVASGGVLALVQPQATWRTCLGVALAVWVLATCAMMLGRRLLQPGSGGVLLARAVSAPRSFYGMLLAHAGVAVFLFGVTAVKTFESSNEVRMQAGDTVQVSRFVFRFDSVSEVQGPNYTAARAAVTVTRDGDTVTVLHPEKRVYTARRMLMTEAAIDNGFTRDLYVSLGEPLDAASWLVRVQVKPFVTWIWGGCIVMALGGLLAASDKRYRHQLRGSPEQTPARLARAQAVSG